MSVNTLQQTKKLEVQKDIIERLDEDIINEKDILFSNKKSLIRKINNETLEHIFRMSLLSIPKDNKKEEIIKEISKRIFFVKNIKKVNVKGVEKLVSVRIDKPIHLISEDAFNKVEIPPKWDVTSLTRNKEGNFFVIHQEEL
ncbi:hypothetical protein PCANB_001718 [Pneumocystis canis]|nr:hypothetical protein PCK1_002143 [Pneumocystis canis]KAG5440149.1 hypothetical protein PCANB_001718 [Pneumocystis canis]